MDIQKVEDALSRAQALYAVYQSAVSDAQKVNEAGGAKVAAARAAAQKVVEEVNEASRKADSVVEEKKQAVVDYQEQVASEVGITIDLFNSGEGARRVNL